ncbi:hypothetical protein ABW20_dc0109559 [Dactylellina cionopaga]|nr:hypothetical protein ABW20_dc0109559 [Dactylellina cionopaga]
MSPVADSNLARYLIEAASSNSKRCFLLIFMGCLTKTLWFIHRRQLRHRDIKPENILVHKGQIMFTDFDCSYSWAHTNRSTTTKAPPRTWKYASPEVARSGLQESNKINSSSDIWSLGCVFLEMMTVFKGKSINELDSYLQKHHYYTNLTGISQWIDELQSIEPNSSTNIALDCIKGMLREDPEKRLTAHDLVEMVNAAANPMEFCCAECLEMGSQPVEAATKVSDTTTSFATTEELKALVGTSDSNQYQGTQNGGSQSSTDVDSVWTMLSEPKSTVSSAPTTEFIMKDEPKKSETQTLDLSASSSEKHEVKTFSWNAYLTDVCAELGKSQNSLSRDQLMTVMASYTVYQKGMVAAGLVEVE